jgi:hypothetical protein
VECSSFECLGSWLSISHAGFGDMSILDLQHDGNLYKFSAGRSGLGSSVYLLINLGC